MKLRLVSCFTILILLSFKSLSQTAFSISSNLHYGFVIPHHASVVNLIQAHSKALEINLNWTTNGSKSWHSIEKFPGIGIDFFVSSLGNNKQLGNQYSTMGYINFPLGKNKHHYLKTGLGVGYASKTWDIENNPKNIFLSSHFNATILLQYSYKILVTETMKLKTGVRITHFSNGSMKLPNKGTNNVTCFLGLSFRTNKKQKYPISLNNRHIDDYQDNKYSLSTLLVTGLKQMNLADKKKYSIFSFTNIVDKRVSLKTSWGIGLDMFYNSGLRNIISNENGEPSSRLKAMQLAGLISYTKHLFPLEIKIMAGVYIIDNYKITGPIYSRFALRYFTNNHLFAGLSLKTHYARADFFELGIGWRF